MASKPATPRILNPRTTGYTHRPILAIDPDTDTAVLEGSGEVLTTEQVMQLLPTLPSSIIVTLDSARLLKRLDDKYAHHPRWQYRLTPIKRPVLRANGEISKARIGHTLVNFFGWMGERKNNNLYHYPIDPLLFCRIGINELLPAQDSREEPNANRALRLLQWGQDVRAWCETQNIRVTPTSGGLAAQLMKDPRWWPDARRKVPRATNDRVRPILPGNYYRLYAETGMPYQAVYFDMNSSHHTIAQSVAFPHPDTLTARGYFHVPDVPGVTVPEGRPWARRGTRAYERIIHESTGLIYAHLTTPPIRDDKPGTFPLPYLRNTGRRMRWIYTNEIPELLALRVVIDWITAAWVSFDRDAGMNRYAKFALEELKESTADRKRWLKPSLLSAYGIVAARPQETEFAYRQAKGGKDKRYPAGSGMLPAKAMTQGERESPLVNVMYRGLIEAEQRVRTLQFARFLHGHGHRVLAIYADSVFTEQGPPIPFLPDGWKIEGYLDALYFNSATHFTSRQITKLPGVKRETLERVQLMAQIRGER